jgi:hypothetical protein
LFSVQGKDDGQVLFLRHDTNRLSKRTMRSAQTSTVQLCKVSDASKLILPSLEATGWLWVVSGVNMVKNHKQNILKYYSDI